jgi:hypothetical protein
MVAMTIILVIGGFASIYIARVVFTAHSQPTNPKQWTFGEKEALKTPLSQGDLVARTKEFITEYQSANENPYLAWEQSRNARSVPLKMGTGSEALRNAEHFLWARAFVSLWNSKPARAAAGGATIVGQFAWSAGKIFDRYSRPTCAEFQSAIDGIIAGYNFPGRASKTAGAEEVEYYSKVQIVNKYLMAGGITMLVVIAVVLSLIIKCGSIRRESKLGMDG